MSIITQYSSYAWVKFWTPSFWLPSNITWSDFKDTEDVVYPKFQEICYPVAYSIIVVFVRLIIERCIFLPWGLQRGLKQTKKKVAKNVLLEEAYKQGGSDLPHSKITGLAKQLDWSVRQVEQWIRHRKQQNKPSALVKLTESGWRFTYYSFAVCYGLWALWDKPWFWNIDECWTNYPHQTVSWDIRLYYVFQLSCYWSMLFSQFVDVKRKDFLEMFIHHLTTILLIIFSYTCNLIRGGSLVLIIHDFSDVFMEAAKIFKYIKWQRGCDTCFGLFFIVWTVTRLMIFPGYLIKNFWLTAPNFMPMFPAYNALKYLVVVLFLLHIMWTYFILKILKRALLSGKTERDSRSSSSEASATEDTSDQTASSVRLRKK